MTEAAFEAQVRRALLEANRRDFAFALAGEVPEPAYSPIYLRRRIKLLADPFRYAKKAAQRMWKKVLGRAACLLLAAGLTFGAAVTFHPQARAWFQRIISEWFADHNRITFGGADSDTDPAGAQQRWMPSYVPEGFELEIEDKLGYMMDLVFENRDGVTIELTYVYGGHGSFAVDNEHQDAFDITINGSEGTLLRANEPGRFSYVIWWDETYRTAFMLCSEFDADELIKMAESVAPEDK